MSDGARKLVAAMSMAALIVIGWWSIQRRSSALVVYCAHDAVFAQGLFERFTEKTGLAVEPVWDTEAAKSLGLVQRIEREQQNPICDVFWNNEPLGTMSLASAGLFESYQSPEAAKRPAVFRGPENRWTGFGVRYRVWIVNTDKMPGTMEAIDQRMNSDDLSHVAIAEPLYGTTLTHWSLLWNRLGPEKLQEWHRSLKARGVHFVKGNAAVRDLVGAGTCDLGMTDTDDFFGALDAKHPVAMLPIRVENQTIAIPNTVSVVKGARHPEEARKFVDFMLSAESDTLLAKSGSRQSPVHSDVKIEDLPAEIRGMQDWAKDGADLSGLSKSRDECLAWLLKEFAP
ncbi:MAG TPA: extracellular solute-binding protein [Caulifigura sp.]|nr:extracellular solute-binding protein [Caulifigura sp.]